jgi:hypothetical protein
MFRHMPPPVGIAYLIVAISIMAGAVAGRYHYVADVVLGAVVASIGYLATIAATAFEG